MKYIRIFLFFLLLPSAVVGNPIQAVLFDGTGTAPENKLIAMTIAGIVNRESPRLYLLNVYETWSYNQTDEKWRDIYVSDGDVYFTVFSDINALVQHFSEDIDGAVTYDPSLTYGNFSGQNFRWQAEMAAMIGGLTDCIPLPFNNSTIEVEIADSVLVTDHFHGQDPIRISARLELGDHPWNNSSFSQEQRYFTILNWALETLLTRTNPSKFYLREITDWAVSQRMFQLNLAGTESLNFYSLTDEKAEMIEQVMAYLRSCRPGEIFHVYGWMRPEPLVQWISAWGGSFHETLLSNLSWHHIFPVDDEFPYQRPSIVLPGTVPLEEKHYVLFLGSEGDAGNWNLGFQGGAWHSGLRGEVPLGWGFNLHMFETFPFVGQYYFRTATAKDGFVSVTTPLGYAYPDVFPADYLSGAIETSSLLLQAYSIPAVYAYKHYNGAGVSTFRGIEISNNFNFGNLGNFSELTGTDLTFLFDPGLTTQKAYINFGGLLYNHVNDDTFYADVQDLQNVTTRILNKLRNKPAPNFLLAGYQRLRQDGTTVGASNPSDMTLSRLNIIMQNIQEDPEIGQDVVFVTPEQFSDLLRQKLDLVTSVAQPIALNVRIWFEQDILGAPRLHLSLPEPQDVTVRVFDMSGKILYRTEWEAAAGHNVIPVPLWDRPSGVYLINVSSKTLWVNQKLIY
ncbi:MAG: T9SS type A sorting domain-containing protein [Bacteroides sp.]|jgi:hypothetical protein|nr:T9SS type A sorting domain-containing protein [Bacteroides sp.]